MSWRFALAASKRLRHENFISVASVPFMLFGTLQPAQSIYPDDAEGTNSTTFDFLPA
jgi:hypothetical protein